MNDEASQNILARFIASEKDTSPWTRTKFAEARSYDPTWRDNVREYVAKVLGIDLDQRLSPAMENALSGISGRGTTPGIAELIVPPIGAGGQVADAARAVENNNLGAAAMHTAMAALPYVPWSKGLAAIRQADLRQTYPNAAAAYDLEARMMGRDGGDLFKSFGERIGSERSGRAIDPRIPNEFEQNLPNAERIMRDKLDANPIFDGAIIPPGESVKLRGSSPYAGKQMDPRAYREDTVDYTVMAPMQSHAERDRVKYHGRPVEHMPEAPNAQSYEFDQYLNRFKDDGSSILDGVFGPSWLAKSVGGFNDKYAAAAALKRHQPIGARTIPGPWRSPRDQGEIAEAIPDLPSYTDPRLAYLRIGGGAASSAAAFDGETPNMKPWWWPQ